MSSKKSKQVKYKSHFQDLWLTDSEFSGWLKKDKSNTNAFCKVCMKSFSVANHGKKSLQLHAAGDKHKSRLPSDSQTKLVQLVSNRKENNDNEKEKDEQVSTTPSVKTFFINEAVTDAEILWVLDVILSKYSLNSCSNKNELFATMFKDSKIAQSFKCGSTKCSYIINFGLAPYFLSLLEQSLKDTPYHVRCFDESYNNSIKKGQMDMHIRYWNQISSSVSTRYYNSVFLTKASAADILEKFESCSKDLNANKMIQVLIPFNYSFYIHHSFFEIHLLHSNVLFPVMK